jgi:hypothetical protein
MVQADTSDVAFRLFLSLAQLWDGLERAGIDATKKGLHLTREDLGGYTRYSAGPGTHSRLIVEWNDSSRHLRVLRNDAWSGFESVLSASIAHVREQARLKGIIEAVDAAFMKACQEPVAPCRRTIVQLRPAPTLARRA